MPRLPYVHEEGSARSDGGVQGIKEAKEVISIGPKNQAKGILKYSAIIALGIDIMMTDINGIENICLKFSLLKGIAWLFCIIHDFRIYRNW